MGMTMTQKILAAHCRAEASVKAGQLINAKLDMVLGNDITTPVAINEFEKAGFTLGVRQDPHQHGPGPLRPQQGHQERASSPNSAGSLPTSTTFVNFFDVGTMGIEHALLPEQGIVDRGRLHHRRRQPHLHLWCAGRLFHRRRLHRHGRRHGDGHGLVQGALRHQGGAERQPPAARVRGKDVILHLIGKIGVDGRPLQEPWSSRARACKSLSMDDRLCICNMAIEAGAKNGIFPVDEACDPAYLKARGTAPLGQV